MMLVSVLAPVAKAEPNGWQIKLRRDSMKRILARSAFPFVVFLLPALFFPALLVGAETQIVSPQELVTLVKKGQKIKLVLKTGTYAEGRLEVVSSTNLTVNVRKTHDARDLPMGVQELPYDRVASVTVRIRKGGKRWKLPLILCGTLGTASFVLAMQTEEFQSTYVPAAVGFTAALGVGGYFAGNAMDKQWVTYVVKSGG
jgi:hypothetical protein